MANLQTFVEFVHKENCISGMRIHRKWLKKANIKLWTAVEWVQLNKEKKSEYKNGIHLISLDTMFVSLFMTYDIISE